MTGETARIFVMCITGAAAAVLLKQYCREQALLTSLTVCVLVSLSVVGTLSPVVGRLSELFEKTGLDGSYFGVIMKAVGICFITGTASDICRDSGEQALAGAAELWGRVSLLVLALPMAESILELISGVLQ